MRYVLAAVLAAALTAGCGLVSSETVHLAMHRHGDAQSATVHFEAGRQAASFRMHEPSGVILLYRISAPVGTEIEGSAQLPSVTVPLLIRAEDASESCTQAGARIICTVGEEWCPMPEGVWHFRLTKLAGPAGDVTLWFKVGPPPGQRA
jgi:hypothetical protein